MERGINISDIEGKRDKEKRERYRGRVSERHNEVGERNREGGIVDIFFLVELNSHNKSLASLYSFLSLLNPDLFFFSQEWRFFLCGVHAFNDVLGSKVERNLLCSTSKRSHLCCMKVF